MQPTEKQKKEKFTFLHSHIAKEPHIYELLNEISNYQNKVLKSMDDNQELVTIETLRSSRNIRIPFTASRNKNINYLLELLLKNYPETVRKIITFEFIVQEPKNLSINIKNEFTVLIKNDDFNRIKFNRDARSINNFLNLLTSFRLFNLTKLIKKSKEKSYFSELVRKELSQNIFTFKYFTIDKNRAELSEDYCFHKNNYEAVKKNLRIENLNKIISLHADPVNRRLKKFGIINSEFSDYRDTKLDYILNILLEEIPASLAPKDMAELKNINSLRRCLLKVDKIIDPMIALNTDIVNYITENGICRKSEISSIFNSLPEEILSEWEKINLEKNKILSYANENGETYYISGTIFMPELINLYELILHNENFTNFLLTVQQEKIRMMDMLCSTGRTLLLSEEQSRTILNNEHDTDTLKQIISDYEEYRKSISAQSSLNQDAYELERHGIIVTIVNFFKSIFKSKEDRIYHENRKSSVQSSAQKTPIPKETNNIYSKIKNDSDSLIPLSYYLEIVPENETRIDSIISEIRNNNLKIVIPVYNAKEVLYPVRSQHYLIADIEYLLVDAEIIQSYEAIMQFIDSLSGKKIREETIPGRAIIAIEKYLLTLYRQKRTRIRKK